ncbi:hypothetical protein LMG29660_02881 [Burkholderia puraquae]|uniref:Uncharacterized protein n=1 Tax=Burkholderia puraquae TaxID=1904757 RepID=A0A6J5DSH0_9BURK|nr:hypothetical protein LMG29660_02881 [Burkholderia puraquae]
MSRIAIPAIETATGATADVYAQIRKVAGGTVPNLFAAVGHLAPHALAAVLNAEGALAGGTLSKQDLETIKLLVSADAGLEDRAPAQHHVIRDLARRRSFIRDRPRRAERAADFELPGDRDERHEAAQPVGFERHVEWWIGSAAHTA